MALANNPEQQTAGLTTAAIDQHGSQLGRQVLLATAAALGVSGATAVILGGIAGLFVHTMVHPRRGWGTGEPPEGLAEEITFASPEDGTRIAGWFFRAPSTAPAPAVVLCHGVWTSRRECLPLALRLHEAGYHVLSFDFRAHGASEGRFTSIGHFERHDVIGAVDYLLTRLEVDPARIGVVGFSMGASSAIRAAAASPHIAAVVADSGYSSFVDAMRFSFRRVGHLPHYPFGPLALQWGKWLLRIDPNQLRPVDDVPLISPRPLLIIHGEDDEIVPVGHAYELYEAAGEPKELWIASKAHHVGARDVYPDEYYQRLADFLGRALAHPAPVEQRPLAA